MPMLKPILAKYVNDVFVETGTLNGEAVRLALDCGFKEAHSIDIDKPSIENQKRVMTGAPVHFYHGSSADVLPVILQNINGRITFWLDAHPSGNLTLFNTPVLAEITAIRDYAARLKPGELPTVLIDDMRLFTLDDRKMICNELMRLYPGELFGEDTPWGQADILGYKPFSV